MGWEQRGNNSYYYKKVREGPRVKSTYVGRGEVAHMVAKLASSSGELERLLRAKKSMEALESERAETTLERAVELIQLFTQASLISAGFHTHKRQWRRKRSGNGF